MKRILLTTTLLLLCAEAAQAHTIAYCGKSTLAQYHTLLSRGVATASQGHTLIDASPELATDAEAQVTQCLAAVADVYIVNPIIPDDARWASLTGKLVIALDQPLPAWADAVIAYDWSPVDNDIRTLHGAYILEGGTYKIPPGLTKQQERRPSSAALAGKTVFIGGHSVMSHQLMQTIKVAGTTAIVVDVTPTALAALKSGAVSRIYQRDAVGLGAKAAEAAIAAAETGAFAQAEIRVPVVEITHATRKTIMKQLFPKPAP